MTAPHARGGRWRSAWLLTGALVLFMAFVVYRSLQVAGYRCSVCIEFRGQTVCRTVDGSTEHDARMAASNNACAYLAGGVTDTMACERTEPTKVDCSALTKPASKCPGKAPKCPGPGREVCYSDTEFPRCPAHRLP